MLYVLYGLLFVLVLFVSEYLITLTVPIIAGVLPGISESLLNAALLSLIALPIILSILYTQRIIARDFAVRSLQLKISLIGAVPLISALALILMFFHERFTQYTETRLVLSTIPQTTQVTKVIHLLEELRDEDYYYIEAETTSEHEQKHEEVARQLQVMSEDFKKLADSEDFVYDEFLQVVQTLLYDKVDRIHSDENRESTFAAYSESIRMLSDLRREINFNYQLSITSQLHDFIRELDAVREILSIERSLLGKVFERGYFLPSERDMFIQLRTDMATWRQ